MFRKHALASRGETTTRKQLSPGRSYGIPAPIHAHAGADASGPGDRGSLLAAQPDPRPGAPSPGASKEPPIGTAGTSREHADNYASRSHSRLDVVLPIWPYLTLACPRFPRQFPDCPSTKSSTRRGIKPRRKRNRPGWSQTLGFGRPGEVTP